MNDMKSKVPVGVGILCGLYVIFSKGGVWAKLTNTYELFTVIHFIIFLLYAVGAMFAWQLTKKEDDLFFKWLAAALLLMVALMGENMLFRLFVNPDPFTEGKNLLLYMQRANTIFVHLGNVLVMMLMVFAVFNYRDKVNFLTVFKPAVMFLMISAFTLGTIVPMFLFARVPHLLTPNSILSYMFLLELLIMAWLYYYGFRTSITKYRLFPGPLFQWVGGFFLVNLAAIIINILVIVPPQNGATNWLFYIFYFFNFLAPVLLITVLALIKNLRVNGAVAW
ncbi:hypothetical protein [Desulforamulus ruminis]|uniref:hypothetical protein n=1 Tax=Desulforamulus ruminis TaxID=1564 RepID=UPI002357DACF|nr:hypothetical protein [Desulforamulus ruminis]